MADFPGIAGLAETADGGLHPAVHAWVPRPDRLGALREQLRWEVDVAGRDLEWARDFAVHQPASGAPAEMFLNRRLPAADDLTVLAGPRYEGRHPDRPFVEGPPPTDCSPPPMSWHCAAWPGRTSPCSARSTSGCGPPTRPAPGPAPVRRCGWSRPPASSAGATPRTRSPSGPPRTCPGTTGTSRSTTSTSPPTRHTRTGPGSRQPTTSTSCARAGTLFEVLLDGNWAGVLAAEPAVAHGLRGATVVELLLTHEVRGRGLGKDLSVLLARNLPLPDDHVLHGTIHIDNHTARRSALAAGRIDVGGRS